MTQRVLIIAAHPDDEVLGCGATIAKHASQGDAVDILIVAEGSTSRDPVRNTVSHDAQLAALRVAAERAAATLGARPPRLLGFPDNRLDGVELLDVIKPIESLLADLRPAIVYTHHAGDLNIDHRIVHQATVTACRPLPGSPVRALYAFETVSSTEWSTGAGFRPTHFVDVTGFLARKLAALEPYAAEMRVFPHARSREAVQALATVRGAAVGLHAAEAFEVIREIAS